MLNRPPGSLGPCGLDAIRAGVRFVGRPVGHPLGAFVGSALFAGHLVRNSAPAPHLALQCWGACRPRSRGGLPRHPSTSAGDSWTPPDGTSKRVPDPSTERFAVFGGIGASIPSSTTARLPRGRPWRRPSLANVAIRSPSPLPLPPSCLRLPLPPPLLWWWKPSARFWRA